MKYVLITGADRGVGSALSRTFLENGYVVFSGQYMPEWPELDALKKEFPDTLHVIPLDVGDMTSVRNAYQLVSEVTDRLDILVNCAGVYQVEDDQSGYNCINVNAVGNVRMVETFLPLMQTGEKRLCFFSSEAGCVSLAHRKAEFQYCVSKTTLNMAIRLMFNRLNKEGFIFRVYHPGWVRSYMNGYKLMEAKLEPEETAPVAFRQFTSDRNWEDVLMLMDVYDQIWPF